MKRLLCAVLAAVMVLCLLPVTPIRAHAASAMKGSDEILNYLKTMEGFIAVPQWDIAQWTVGYGTKCPDEDLERYLEEGIPLDEAEELFREYIIIFENYVNRFIDENDLTLNQNQFDALLSLSYNCGIAWMYNNSSLSKAIISGATGNRLIGTMSQHCTAGGQYLTGLMRRRLTEACIFLYGDYGTEIPDSFGYVFFDAGKGKASAVAQGYDCNMYAVPLVTATYEGHTFLGWYTAAEGGVKVTSLDENLNGMTLYAHWEKGNGGISDSAGTDIDAVLVTVTGEVVNVRSGPGIDYSIKTQVTAGTQLAITQVATTNNRLWGRCDQGWICLDYTNFHELSPETDTPDAKPGEGEQEQVIPELPIYATILGVDNLSVYNGPHNSYPVIGSLKEGDQVLVVEMYKMFNNWWCRLETGGWIRLNVYVMLQDSQMLAHSFTAKVENSFLNVRSGPGTEYTWLFALNKGDQIEILAVEVVEEEIWGRFSGGWVSLSYTDFDPEQLEQYWHHSYNDWYNVTQSTCVTNGSDRRDCVYCDHYETRSLELTGHTYNAWYESVAATCTAGGQERRDCVYCDVFETRDTEMISHSMGQWYEVEAGTCVSSGLIRRDCDHCDYYETEATEALGHSMEQWYAVEEATCVDGGLSRRDCANCDYYETEATEAAGHSFGQWSVLKEAGCETEGINRRDCEICGEFELEEIPAVGHSFGQWYETVIPTVDQYGEERRDCKVCDAFEVRPLEPTEHVYGEWYVTLEPTCTQAGEERRDCTGCDHYTTREVEALGHSYSDWVEAVAPGCTEEGQQICICQRCYEVKTETIAAVGHVIGEWYTLTEGTCVQEGMECRDCENCEYSETRNTAFGDHELGDWYMHQMPTCMESGEIRRDCNNCDYCESQEASALGHNMGAWYVAKEATCDEDGMERRDCTFCDHYETVALEKLEHSLGEWYLAVEPTYITPGQERRDCDYCDYYEIRETECALEIITRVFGTLTGSDQLNIRASATTNSARVGQLLRGDRVEILEQTTVNGKVWGRIEQGWIMITGYMSLETVEEAVEHTHKMGQWYVAIEATCVTNGQRRRECASCEYIETEQTALADHVLGSWYTVKEATPEEKGLECRDCVNCDFSESRETERIMDLVTKIYGTLTGNAYLNIRASATTNSAKVGQLRYGDRVEILEQTTVDGKVWGRIEQGWIMITGYMTLETVEEMVEHTHVLGDWYTETAPACTTDGGMRRDCAGCSYYETMIVSAVGHSMGEWNTVKEATATEKGVERRECNYCDYAEERETDYKAPAVTKVYATIIVDALNVRATPGTGGSWAGVVYKGAIYEVYEQTTVSGNVWGRIDSGWICLTGCATLEEVEETGSNEVKVMTVTATTLNVRAGAGTGYSIVAVLTYGTEVTVFEQVVVNGTTWARIERGWVSMAYLA